ncbi:MAG: DEAD/DEAH box helicase [Porphyromonadaceae bacterium CG2_30_38_12]|nr:MAG: DEAD/DEAH box helicase [Porphyromonadaceae bacterium CG2_30_38_12]
MQFSDFNITTSMLNALSDLHITVPTTIQEKAFPVIMSGRDVVGVAQTGTGKTIAYLLPCLRQWKFSKEKAPTVLIVVPTRELVLQVVDDVEQLTKYMNVRVAGVFGGVNMIQQTPLILKGIDILVATPGRLLDFALNGSLKLRLIKRFIIDEVDEMLNLGFRPQLIRIIDLLPAKRQNLMFSATITDELKLFIADFFTDPLEIEAARTGTPLVNIKQAAIKVPNFNTKINLLKFLLQAHAELSKVLVFVSTKKLADDVYEKISVLFPNQVGIIHSNKSQNFRLESFRAFNANELRVLIATDLVARGLDFDDISHVINFDIPEIPENYMHRIGRTGRADKKGVAIAFVTKNDKEMLTSIEALMQCKVGLMKMPDEVEISALLTDDELPKIVMKNALPNLPKPVESGPAFHEKKDKNKKVNQKIRRPEAMRIKYGKPKTRGEKKL